MNETVKRCRAAESSLELSAAEMNELSSQIQQLVTGYFSQLPDLPVFPQTHAGKTLDEIGRAIPEEGEPLEQLLHDCRAIIENSRHNGHPRFFGYVASPSTPPGAFADLIASALNINVTTWRSGPAATEIERTVERWLGSLIGYNDDAAGLLTSGGSMANLTALMIAHRAKSGAGVASQGLWNLPTPMTIYASDQVHMSIPKAADILGLGRAQVRMVKSDNRFRMDVPLLRETSARDIESGVKPFCVVGSAGTVNTGAVDPLDEIAKVAKEFDLWFHVDGAYGALAALD
jgi:aromatic-L-amino-acid decarboxylase